MKQLHYEAKLTAANANVELRLLLQLNASIGCGTFCSSDMKVQDNL